MPRAPDPILERLKTGIRKFQAEVYLEKADKYREIVSKKQKPHSLVIACADSRVDVETITSAEPGDVFITRNVGNMAPAYGETPGGVAAVIEYAVAELHVGHIAVCGHSDCGAMKTLESCIPPSMPNIAAWLTHGRAALRIAEEMCRKDASLDLRTVLTEQNALMQVAHLRTHPHVAGALAQGSLTLSAWVYDIGSGTVSIWHDGDPRAQPEVLRPVSKPAAKRKVRTP